MASTTSTAGAKPVTLREAEPADLEPCAQICFDAFGAIHDQHRFPRDFPALEAALGLLEPWIAHPAVWGVVAEADGRIVGSNFLDERDPVEESVPSRSRPTARTRVWDAG